MGVVLLDVVRERRWYCPNCEQTAVTHDSGDKVTQQFHRCDGLAGFPAPMVEDGVEAHVTAVERDDYEGADQKGIQRDGNGRPIMAVVTTRDDGEDRTVYAPTAQWEASW